MSHEPQLSIGSTGSHQMEAQSVLNDIHQYRDPGSEAQRMEQQHPLSNKFGLLVELTLTLLKELEQLKDTQELQSRGQRQQRLSLKEQLRRFEIEMIRNALIHTGGHQSRAARLLGVKITTLHEKIKRYGIDPNLSVENDDAGSSLDVTGEEES